MIKALGLDDRAILCVIGGLALLAVLLVVLRVVLLAALLLLYLGLRVWRTYTVFILKDLFVRSGIKTPPRCFASRLSSFLVTCSSLRSLPKPAIKRFTWSKS